MGSSAKMKAALRHCLNTYRMMEEQSEPYSVDNPDVLIYKGYLTKLITEQLGLPTSYYTFITKELLRMGCVEKLQRGGGGSKSHWLLLKEPNQNDFEHMPKLKQDLTAAELADLQFKHNTNERLLRIENKLGIGRPNYASENHG